MTTIFGILIELALVILILPVLLICFTKYLTWLDHKFGVWW